MHVFQVNGYDTKMWKNSGFQKAGNTPDIELTTRTDLETGATPDLVINSNTPQAIMTLSKNCF